MNELQKKKLTRLLILRVLLRSNVQLFVKMPNIEEYLTELDAVIEDILGLKLRQTDGASAKKDEYQKQKATLLDVLLEMMKKLHSYGVHEKNAIIIELTGKSKNQLAKMDDTELIELAKRVYQFINDLLAGMRRYELSVETQQTFLDAIAVFETVSPEFSKVVKGKKMVTSTMGDLYKLSDAIVEKIDVEVELVSKFAPDFYKEYQIQRKISVSTDVMQLLVHVTDAATNKPLPNVSITLQAEGKDPIVKTTAEKGGFMHKSIDPGIYNVTAEKIGYQSKTFSITITGDAPYNLNIGLESV